MSNRNDRLFLFFLFFCHCGEETLNRLNLPNISRVEVECREVTLEPGCVSVSPWSAGGGGMILLAVDHGVYVGGQGKERVQNEEKTIHHD